MIKLKNYYDYDLRLLLTAFHSLMYKIKTGEQR